LYIPPLPSLVNKRGRNIDNIFKIRIVKKPTLLARSVEVIYYLLF